jgi:hypothetical protein
VDVKTQEWLQRGAEATDQSMIEQSGPAYPFIQWVNGKRNQQRAGGVPFSGGWFAKGDQFDGDLPGWTKDALVFDSGDSTDGFFIRDLTVAVIRSRRCWQVKVGERAQVFPWDQYDLAKEAGKPSGKLQVLVAVKGLEDINPVVLTMKGSTSKAFAPSKTGQSVISTFDQKVMNVANTAIKKTGRRLARYAFWLTVGPDRDGNGNPIFTQAGSGSASSPVTLPVALGLKAKMSLDDIAPFYVGTENIQLFQEFYAEAEQWARAFDKMQTQDTEAEPENPNDLKDVEEEEIPF